PPPQAGKAAVDGQASEIRPRRSHRGKGGSTHGRELVRNKGSLLRGPRSAAGWSTTNPRGPASAGADGGGVRTTKDAGECRPRKGALTCDRGGTGGDPGDWRKA